MDSLVLRYILDLHHLWDQLALPHTASRRGNDPLIPEILETKGENILPLPLLPLLNAFLAHLLPPFALPGYQILSARDLHTVVLGLKTLQVLFRRAFV